VVEGHAIVGLIDLAFAVEAFEGAADGFPGEPGHATKLFVRELHEEGDGEIATDGAVVEVVHAGPVEEGARELTGGGGGERETAGGEEGAVVLASEGQSGGAADVGVGFHEENEIGAGDALDGAGHEGFGSDAIECVFAQSGEAEDVAGTGDTKEQQTAICGGGGDFDAATADNQQMVGCEAFADENGVGFATAADADRVEVAKDCTRKRAGVVGRGCRNVCKTARKDSGPPETQRKVACAGLYYCGNPDPHSSRLTLASNMRSRNRTARRGLYRAGRL
jgi:hypothetical protein